MVNVADELPPFCVTLQRTFALAASGNVKMSVFLDGATPPVKAEIICPADVVSPTSEKLLPLSSEYDGYSLGLLGDALAVSMLPARYILFA